MTRALVVGSGVGGLTATVALRLAGVEVDVFERATGPRAIRVGGGLHVWANGMRALQRVGLAERVEAVGERIERLDWHSPRRGLLAHADLASTARRVGAPSIGVRRADLLGVLLDEVGPDTIRFGAEVTGVEQDADGVVVRFSDGGRERGDLLVAADGLRSTLRAQVVGPSELLSPGVLICQATVDGAARAASVFAETWDADIRLGCYPVRGGLFWFAFVRSADVASLGPDLRAGLLARTVEWTAPGPELIELTPATSVGAAEVVARQPLERWSAGRITLLGDAAHAMTPFGGQGACQALEDAVVVADCLRAERDVVSALRSYDARRVPRTTEIWRRSWAAATSAARRSRSIDPGRRGDFAATFERVVWKQLEQTIAYEF